MGHKPSNLHRDFLMGVMAIITVSILVTCVTGEYAHWLATIAGILVLYRLVRRLNK